MTAKTRSKVVVVGAGITGLTAALALAKSGHEVVVVARNMLGDESTEWCSPWAGALLAPHPDSEYPELQARSLQLYQSLLHDRDTGIKEISITEYYDDRPETSPIWYKTHVKEFRQLPRSELPQGTTLGFSYVGLIVNPNDFLPWLMKNLRARGVVFIQKTLSSLDEASEMTGAAMVVNASGLGSAQLASDPLVQSARGQTMLVEQRDFNRVIIRQGSEYTYAIPRPSDGVVILGGVSQYGSTEPNPDPKTRPDILSRVNKMTKGAFDWVDIDLHVKRDIVGFRPGRKGGLRLEKERNNIHAYGVTSLGYLYALGIAEKITMFAKLERGREMAKL